MVSSYKFIDNVTNQKLFNALKKRDRIIKILLFVIFILVSFIVGFLTSSFVSYYGIIRPLHSPQFNISERIHPQGQQFNISENLQEIKLLNTSRINGNSTLCTEDDTKLVIFSRAEWLAQPPTHPLEQFVLPVRYVIIQQTVTENCSNPAACAHIARYIQADQMGSMGWWDIGYNFLVGGDGYVYEGRGWKGQGDHALAWNSKSIGIAFIGTFHKIPPPDVQISAANKLIKMGVKDGYIAEDYKLFRMSRSAPSTSLSDSIFSN